MCDTAKSSRSNYSYLMKAMPARAKLINGILLKAADDGVARHRTHMNQGTLQELNGAAAGLQHPSYQLLQLNK